MTGLIVRYNFIHLIIQMEVVQRFKYTNVIIINNEYFEYCIVSYRLSFLIKPLKWNELTY
jgi:hypothetical protein